MHFLSLTTLALASSFINPSFSAPTHENALVERQGPTDAPAALALVNKLYVDVKQYTAVISKLLPNRYFPAAAPRFVDANLLSYFTDSTAADLSKKNKPENKAKAAQTFTAAIASINTLVVKATSDIKALPGSPAAKRDLEASNALAERQVAPFDPTGLATTLTLVLLEIGGALNNIIAILGLSEYSRLTSKE